MAAGRVMEPSRRGGVGVKNTAKRVRRKRASQSQATGCELHVAHADDRGMANGDNRRWLLRRAWSRSATSPDDALGTAARACSYDREDQQP
jgi:hypothetical protein